MTTIVKNAGAFQQEVYQELNQYLTQQKHTFPEDEVIRIDLHCHDYNSNVPDELLGRILRVPETWLPTKQLVKTLKNNRVDAITITNHNNARSCYQLVDKGQDVLVGAEFSCTVPDYNIGIHVLAYGFSASQEKMLNKLRKNIYRFLQYAREHDIPTIWAHPLYHYNVNGTPPMDFFDKMALVFERFEALNGQRDTWQNMLVKSWIEGLTPEKIDADAKKFNIDLALYCSHPHKKSLSGGSDSHMGIFSGQTGTLLHVPQLKSRLESEPISALALEAIKKGRMAPYGTHQNAEKLTVAFLDYVFQIAMYKEDPGLMRLMLHKGSSRDKLLAFLISNAFAEVRRHKVTMRFVELFHNCFMGKVPRKTKRVMVPKVYKPVFDEAHKIAKARGLPPEKMTEQFNQSIQKISFQLQHILLSRLNAKIKNTFDSYESNTNTNWAELIEKLEIPSNIRVLTGQQKNKKKKKKKSRAKNMTQVNLSEFLDGLPFPFLATTLLLGAHFTSSKVLYNNRPILKDIATKLGKSTYPKRMLWLTDTFEDNNGVSMVLREMHAEIKAANLPIDILVCSNKITADENLLVIKPQAEITLPFYKSQTLSVPDLNEVHQLFLTREYDRVICSTEGIMGLIALYLKNAYTVPAHFFIHTDWIMFTKKVLQLDNSNLDRVRRLLRAFYSGFDKLFVLNSDHQKWLTGKEMEFDIDKVYLTAHWVNERFTPRTNAKQSLFKVLNNQKVLLFSGRLSKEKGIEDVVDVYGKLKQTMPELLLVFAGTGPAEAQLKKTLPDALFLGWVENQILPQVYSSADLLILPSKFDTFSLVVLEALSCGLPVVAYKSKGPKDIIEHESCGFLAKSKKEMANQIRNYLQNHDIQPVFRNNAVKRAAVYNKKAILNQFLEDLHLA